MVGSAAAALVGLGFLVACSDDDGAAPAPIADGGVVDDTGAVVVDAGPTPTDVCKAYIRAYCDRSNECGVGDPGCAAFEALCPDYVFGAGSARTVADVIACTVTRRQQSCSELAAGITPSCAPAGTLAAGAACNFATGCASYTCLNGGAGACGTCAASSTDGGCSPSCDENPLGPCIACAVNERCVAGACTPLVPAKVLGAGEACSTDRRAGVCGASLRCLTPNAGERTGTCSAPPAAGEPCLYGVSGGQHACAGHCGGALDVAATCDDGPGAEDTRCARNEDCEAALVCSLTGGFCTRPAADGALCPIIPATSSARATCARTSFCKAVPSTGDLEGKCTPTVAPGGACSKGDDRCAAGTSCRATTLDDGGVGPTTCQPGGDRAAIGEPCRTLADCAPNAICSPANVCALPVCQ